jgi:hypothetical protein
MYPDDYKQYALEWVDGAKETPGDDFTGQEKLILAQVFATLAAVQAIDDLTAEMREVKDGIMEIANQLYKTRMGDLY